MSGSSAKFAVKRRLLCASLVEVDLLLDGVAEAAQRALERHQTQRRHQALERAADEEQDRAVEPRPSRGCRAGGPSPRRRRRCARSTARCTCATEAAATGVGLEVRRRSPRAGAPRSVSMVRRTVGERETAARWSRSVESSSIEPARQQVAARRGDLPDLDEGRAERGAQTGQRVSERVPGVASGTAPPQHLAHEDQCRHQRRARHLRAAHGDAPGGGGWLRGHAATLDVEARLGHAPGRRDGDARQRHGVRRPCSPSAEEGHRTRADRVQAAHQLDLAGALRVAQQRALLADALHAPRARWRRSRPRWSSRPRCRDGSRRRWPGCCRRARRRRTRPSPRRTRCGRAPGSASSRAPPARTRGCRGWSASRRCCRPRARRRCRRRTDRRSARARAASRRSRARSRTASGRPRSRSRSPRSPRCCAPAACVREALVAGLSAASASSGVAGAGCVGRVYVRPRTAAPEEHRAGGTRGDRLQQRASLRAPAPSLVPCHRRTSPWPSRTSRRRLVGL